MIRWNKSPRGAEVDAQSLMLECLRTIWQEDEGEGKWKATRILTFIHIASQVDPDAPYFSAKYDEVRELAARDTWGETYQVHMQLTDFDQEIEEYLSAYDNVEKRAKRMADKKIDELNDMIIKTLPTIEKSVNLNTGAFTFQNNTKALSGAVKDVGILREERDKMIEVLRNTASRQTTIRGEKKLSYMERERIKKETRLKQQDEESQEQPLQSAQ